MTIPLVLLSFMEQEESLSENSLTIRNFLAVFPTLFFGAFSILAVKSSMQSHLLGER